MKVKLISITTPIDGSHPEALMVYTARVSSPQNQANLDTGPRLLHYCMRHGHWSVFEMADMTVEIETSRAISAQILRHRSFNFQEFSQRYADPTQLGFETYPARRQDEKNRQNSIDDLDTDITEWFLHKQAALQSESQYAYEYAIANGIAKECARFLLPMSTGTRLYMKGSIRSWVTYLKTRCTTATQKEHRDVARAVAVIFKEQFPVTYEAALLP